MRHNQKYTQEEMFTHVERWKHSKSTQQEICDEIKVSKTTFKNWLKRYRLEKEDPGVNDKIFLSVTVKAPTTKANQEQDLSVDLTITYPNGIKITCPSSICTQTLQTLLKI